MKTLWLLLLLSLYASFAPAQDTTLTLTTGMFSSTQQISLATLPGWVYQAGPARNGANPILNTAGWQKRKPSDLSVNDVTKTGRVEGWFRLRLRLDSTFDGLQVAFLKGNRAAADLYVNGHWLASFGQTGLHQKPYAEFTNTRAYPTLVNLVPGQNYLIALHIVDEVSPFSAHQLKSEFKQGRLRLLSLVGPQFINSFTDNKTIESIFASLWLVVPLLLTVVFGLLSFLNLYEKQIIRILALWGICLTLADLWPFLGLFPLSYNTAYICDFVGNILLFGSIPLLVIALIRILGYPSSLKFDGIIIGVSVFALILEQFIGFDWAVPLATSLQALVFFYVLFKSWKSLKGSQWAIVIGTLSTILFYVLFFFVPFSADLSMFYSVSTGMILSLPLSLLLYIVLRFKEILAEIREKAVAVLEVTEENRQLLITQNERLEQQVELRTAELNQSLTELKATQTQLIQKEKLASLGELTAGIAHEIQNPLNFVNNFSEVSAELVSELKEEAQAGHTEDVLMIADDLTQNLQKIHHHGGRASRIIKGMLEHSRSSSGEKQLTNLNALAEEYLRLAYQGQRTKDKRFTCELITDFGPALPQLEVVPAEIGRVLLNLYNNAFYAVQQRANQAGEEYKPTVRVTTLRVEKGVQLRVSDNGTGIPEGLQQKVFQPFFTTKPTGEGTGLGLSLSYDIITKGHGGSLTLASQPGIGSTLIIELPQRQVSENHS